MKNFRDPICSCLPASSTWVHKVITWRGYILTSPTYTGLSIWICLRTTSFTCLLTSTNLHFSKVGGNSYSYEYSQQVLRSLWIAQFYTFFVFWLNHQTIVLTISANLVSKFKHLFKCHIHFGLCFSYPNALPMMMTKLSSSFTTCTRSEIACKLTY